MELWIIEPHDPLIVRDGRPFGATPGARARPLDFPFPSTIAGGLRTRAGQNSEGLFDNSKVPDVKRIRIRGPLLVELDDADRVEYLVPAPGDALLIEDDKDDKVYRHRLLPLQLGDALSNMSNDLYPVGLVSPDLRKPSKAAPRYWYWDTFARWLATPADQVEAVIPTDLGHNGPSKEWRVHVQIDPRSFASEDGALFATGGLEFWQRPSAEDQQRLSQTKRLALVASVENLNGLTIEEAFAPLGGERRIMRWHKGQNLPSQPKGLAEAIAATGHCRLILLTPAYFEEGDHPSWLLQERNGISPKLKAAIVGKPQTVSGWDFEKRRPKPTRYLVPSGSVFFLDLSKEKNADAIQEWVEEMWLRTVSDDEDTRLAGFGVAAIGVWDGKAHTISTEEANG